MQEDPKYVDAWGYLLQLQSKVVARIEEDLKRQGEISLTWYDVLLTLDNSPGKRLRMSEIADRTISTRSAITRTIDRLVAREWVYRVRSTDDQRGYYAELTDLGASVLREIAPGHVAAVRANLIDLLTESEMAALRDIGEKVRAQLGGRGAGSTAVGSS